jgi:hypothetical protein
VLLIGLIASGGHLRTASMSSQRFIAVDCLVGDSFLPDTQSVLKFNGLEVDLSGFEAWFWFQSIKVSKSEDRISADYKPPDAAVYNLDDATLSFNFSVSGSIPFGVLADEIAMKEVASVCFSLATKETLEQLRDRFRFLEDILILLIDSEYRVTSDLLT